MPVTHVNTRTIPIDDLHPHPDNPNRGDVEAIAASLDEFGQYRAVVALPDGTILAGHHVVEAIRHRGGTEVRVDTIDTDPQTAKRIMLADNRIAELGDGLDPDQLLAVLESLDGDLVGTGYVHMLGNSCRPGGLVFDPFGGSGSTMAAAHVTGRRAALIELDPVYAEVIIERYEALTGDTAEQE